MARYLILAVLILAGCEAIPKAGLDLEDAMHASLVAYKTNANAAIEVLLGAYIKEHERRNLLVAEMNIRDQEFDIEPGDNDPQDEMMVIDSKIALEIVGQFKVDRDARDKKVAEFRAGWANASKNFSRAMRLRNELRRFLELEGVQPEHIKAMSEGIAEAIEDGM